MFSDTFSADVAPSSKCYLTLLLCLTAWMAGVQVLSRSVVVPAHVRSRCQAQLGWSRAAPKPAIVTHTNQILLCRPLLRDGTLTRGNRPGRQRLVMASAGSDSSAYDRLQATEVILHTLHGDAQLCSSFGTSLTCKVTVCNLSSRSFWCPASSG